ncbi:MAG: TolC family protein [Bacteroidota bacterium]
MRRIFIFILLFPFIVSAQQQLTLKNVIDTTLKNSFDIRIAENNVNIAKAYNKTGVAGGLPVIGATASDNGSLTNSYNKNSSGTVSELNNVTGNSVNAGITAGIVLFNGYRITATKERLSLLQKQNEYYLNQEIQTALSNVMIQYYDIIRQQYYVKIMQQLLDVSNKKLDIINTKKDVGMADGIDILQAQMDVNTAKENLRMQQLVTDQSKADLLQLMSAKSQYSFTINDSIVVNRSLIFDSVQKSIIHNPLYLSAVQQVLINQQLVREVSSQRYPSVRLSASYNFGQSDFSAGQYLMNQVYGPSAMLSLAIPIYNGGAYKAQHTVAKLNLNNAQLQEESMMTAMKTFAFKTFQSYTTNLTQLEEQQKSYEMAKQLLDLVMQSFQVNQATILEVKAAQTSFETAGYMLVNLQYAAKVSEIQLLSLMYKLK